MGIDLRLTAYHKVSKITRYFLCFSFLLVDCWDGPDGIPDIKHGKRTLTSSVKVTDVLKTIKENAWIVSE